MPVVAVWWVHSAGVVTSPWVCTGLAIALSLAASMVGNAYWKRCHSSGDIFFSELLLWGWLHRFRSERRLAHTVGLLGLDGGDSQLALDDESLEEKARLLREMAAAVDAQDPYTDGHSRRVALHSTMVARKLGLEREEIAKLRTAAAIHDIGKLRIPVELLDKPGPLSEAEFEIVKRHTDEGAQIVGCMDDSAITAMVRHHHERFDGNGYPSGLVGEQIPFGARIIAVADTFDALTSVRPYRKAIPHKRALEAILGVSGTQLDPAVVRAFLRCYSANRAVLFWTLLVVSPQRALAWIRGKTPGVGNLASTTTAAMPAALTAVVVTAFGTASGVAASRPALRLAQRTPTQQTSIQARGNAKDAKRHAASKGSGGSDQTAAPRSAHKSAVLGVRQTRMALSQRSLRAGGTAGGSGGNSSAPGSRSGSLGGSGGSGGGGGTTPGSAPSSGAAGTSSPVAGTPVAVTVPTTTSGTSNSPTTSGVTNAAGSGTAGGTSSTTGPTGADPGGTGSSGPGGGSGTGTQAGSGASGGSGGSGNSGGDGGSSGPGGWGDGGSGNGSGEPPSKDDCRNDGWFHWGFRNQGQCVDYAEHHWHP